MSLTPAVAGGERDGLDLVLFGWAGLALALPASQVLGLARAQGGEIGTIGDLLGLSAAQSGPPPPNQPCLRIAHPAGPLTLRVEEPVTHCRLPAAAFRALPRALKLRLRLPWVRAIARVEAQGEAGLVVVLDLRLAGAAELAGARRTRT